MREIKFRAWDGETFTHSKGIGDIGWTKFISYDSNTIVEQWSGIKDRYNKNIYDGDIVRYVLPGEGPADDNIEYTEEVNFVDGCFCVDGYTPLYATTDWGVEVIGNIHEHPHLLEPINH